MAEQKREAVLPAAQDQAEELVIPRWTRVNNHIQCESCQGAAARCARMRTLLREPDRAHYLAYLWRCSVCGHEWEDDALRGLNEAAASQARAVAEEP